MKKNQNETAKRQRQDSVTVRDSTARKIETQNKKTGAGHQQYREERSITVEEACNGSAC